MSEGRHTPLPWICDSEGILPISRDGVAVIARIPNHPENKTNWDADAAFIVRAVNSHQEMIDALERARGAINAIVLSTRSVSFDADLRAIDMALAKAKGEANAS